LGTPIQELFYSKLGKNYLILIKLDFSNKLIFGSEATKFVLLNFSKIIFSRFVDYAKMNPDAREYKKKLYFSLTRFHVNFKIIMLAGTQSHRVSFFAWG
jgi:hypothetical protein